MDGKNQISNMELETVNYKQAQELHKLGFPSEVIDINGLEDFECSYISPPENCLAWANNTGIKHPTLELAAKWLRDVKKIHVNILHQEINDDYSLWVNEEEFTDYPTYEDALSDGIDKAIEILMDKGNE